MSSAKTRKTPVKRSTTLGGKKFYLATGWFGRGGKGMMKKKAEKVREKGVSARVVKRQTEKGTLHALYTSVPRTTLKKKGW